MLKKLFIVLMIVALPVSLFAIETSDYDTVTLSKSKEVPNPFCPTTKISDNDKCMSCHILLKTDSGVKWGLKEISIKNNYWDAPSSLDIRQDSNGEVYGYVEINGTGSSQMEDIVPYYARHPEFKKLVIEFFTPGGSVMDAWRTVGFIKILQNRGVLVETHCLGLSASAGIILLVAGDIGHRWVNANAELMIHKVWTITMFEIKTPDTAEDQAEILKHFQKNLNEFIISRSKGLLTPEVLANCIFKKDYWLTGAKAVEIGLADHAI